MSEVFSARAVPVDGSISGRTPGGDGEVGRSLADAPCFSTAPGVTHLRYEVVR